MPDTPRALNFEVNPTDPKALPQGKNHLLVIGIDQYQQVGKLANAVRDAKALRDLLLEKYTFSRDHLTELYDPQASRRVIMKRLRELINRVQPEDNLLVYFSGHGHFDEAIEEAYWVPVDAEYAEIDDYVSYSFLTKIIKAIKSRHTVFIVDSCYSGAALVRERDLQEERFERDPSRWLLASGRNEVVPDGLAGQHSPFADKLLDILGRYAHEGLRISTLVDKLTTAVTYNSRQTPIGRPLYEVGDQGGEFIFRPKRNQAADYQAAQDTGTAQALADFLQAYPDFPQKAAVEARIATLRDEEAWAKAHAQDKISAYRQYLNAFPGGTHARNAIARMGELEEDEVFARAKRRGEAALRQYLFDYSPNGRHLDAAKAEIKRIEQQHAELEAQQQLKAEKARQEAAFWKKTRQDHSPAAYQAYLDQYPKGRYREDARRWKLSREKQEDQWLLASRKDAIDAYRVYLKTYSDAGEPHHQEARERIAQLKAEKKPVPSWYRHRLVRVALFGVLVLMALFGVPLLMVVMIEVSRWGDGAAEPKQVTEATEATVPGEIPLPQMIRIPGGSFQMGSNDSDAYGSEQPVHQVNVSTFYLAETEVTFAQYDYFCQQTGRSKPDDRGRGRGNRPVINVSWSDAQAYCQWVSQQTGQSYRLPTEAEWEYAAGGGSLDRTKWAGTDHESELGEYAWYYKNSNKQTHPVGQKKPNVLGLYDMSGNVWEWCEDDWHSNYKGAPGNGSAWVDSPRGADRAWDANRVSRGGSWRTTARDCRVSYRNLYEPEYRYHYLGVRLACQFK